MHHKDTLESVTQYISPPSAEYINEVIDISVGSFETGNDFNRRIKKDLECKRKAEIDEQKYITNNAYLSVKDEPFKNPGRTRIPGTSFIASPGPRSEEDLEGFFEDTVYHSDLCVQQVVALGATLAYRDSQSNLDFYDYLVKERTISCGSLSASISNLSGLSHEVNSYLGHQMLPFGILNSEIQICGHDNEKKLNVTLFSLEDNCSIVLEESELYFVTVNTVKFHGISPSEYIDGYKERLWQLFQLSQKEPILVHCASGVGRTGHFILTMEILKHYNEIFSGSPEEASDYIYKLLNNMRSVRPGLVNTESQFTNAIHNAHLVYLYAIEKKYIHVSEIENVSKENILSISQSTSDYSDKNEKKTHSPTFFRRQNSEPSTVQPPSVTQTLVI